MILKVISGAQNGVDIAALKCARNLGILTGGTMPAGFKTLDGPKPEYAFRYGIVECVSPSYTVRTGINVADADATLRVFFDANSAGEQCTLNWIHKHKKPYYDINLRNVPRISDVVDWLRRNHVEILNCAGNSEQTAPHIEKLAYLYFTLLFKEYNNL